MGSQGHLRQSFFHFLVLLPVGVLTGCGGGGGSADAARAPASVALSASAATLDRWEDTTRLAVQSVQDADGRSLSEYSVSWSSDQPDIASVDADGIVTSNRGGTATITATVHNAAGSAQSDAIIDVATQRNDACVAATVPARAAPAAAMHYTEVASNTATLYEHGGPRSYTTDLNGDGKDDMLWFEISFNEATLEQRTDPRAWLSDGDGNFTEATSTYLPAALPADLPRQLLAADIDGDADMDYVLLQTGYDPGGLAGLDCSNIACPGAPNMVIVRGDDGKLRDVGPSALNPYDLHGFTHAGGLADADCDGDVDLLEGQLSNADATAPDRLQLNDGLGHFTAKADALPAGIADVGFYGAAFCDLDMDGDPDIYGAQLGVAPGTETADFILVNDGHARFRKLSGRRAPMSRVGDERQRPADLQCLDFDGDGDNDILKPNEADSNFPAFELLRNNGDMTFTDVTDTELVQTPASGGSCRPYLTDLNRDGWTDIVAQCTGDYLRIYWNAGGHFDEYIFPASTAVDTRGANLSIGDFDGDGIPDLHVNRGNYGDYLLEGS